MADTFLDINSIYDDSDVDEFENKFIGDIPSGGIGVQEEVVDSKIMDEEMDENYTPVSEAEASSEASSAGGGMFSDILGPGANVFDPQSIATALTDKYGLDPGQLSAGMFPAMSRNLMEATQASTYDAYKGMLADPKKRDLRKMIASSSGMLNPNKRRQRSLNLYKQGMGDISRNIFSKTTTAREGVRDWLQSALSKVKRLKY